MKATEIFKKHSKLQEFYQTSDGIKFFNESSAKNHAKDLEDKKVVEVKRSSISLVEAEADTKKPANTEPKQGAK